MKRINRSRIDKWNRKIHGNLTVTATTLKRELRSATKELVATFVARRLNA